MHPFLRPSLRRSVLVLGLLSCLSYGVQAQFRRTPWPAGEASPALDLTDLKGQRWSTERLKGRVVVLNFWATWCPPCKEEMPSLQTLHELAGGDPVVLGVNVRETASRVSRYLEATGIGFPVVLDPQAELARRLGVTSLPTTLLLGPDGQVRWRVVGVLDWSGPEAGRWISELSAPVRR